jgi:hypothetical protein
MLRYILVILDYVSILALCVVVLSAFGMLHFLKTRGMEKSRIYSFNPFFFMDYLSITRNETGKSGFWMRLCIISAIAGIVAGILSIILTSFSES